MNNNKAMWIVLGVIVIILIVLAIVFGGKKNMTSGNQNNPPATQEPESTEDVSGATAGGGTTGAASLSYQQALIKYADKRIQLDAQCGAHPNVVTYKDNTGIMIDNRSAVTRTVKVGSTYTIKPWGFRIIMLPNTTTRVSTYFVDCDAHQNVASIEVQE